MASITYGTLKTQVINNIKSMVKNIDTLNVPSSLVTGFTKTILSSLSI